MEILSQACSTLEPVTFVFLMYEMADPVRFSRGMKNLTDSIHALGFKTGIVSEKSNKFLVFC